MKGLKYAKKIKEESSAFLLMIEEHCDKINKEYQKQMYLMLEQISIGEGLDLKMLQAKYLKTKSEDTNNVSPDDTTSAILFDKIVYENTTYYIDKNNTVYDNGANVIGRYDNKKVVLI